MRAKILYSSYSGNTKELAELIKRKLIESKVIVEIEDIHKKTATSLDEFDLVLLGTFTRGEGDLPITWRKYFSEGMYEHKNVAIFGTGDTQWEHYCGACSILCEWFNSPYDILKVEQYPDKSQHEKINKWIGDVLNGIN